MFGISFEHVVILGVVLLVFGPKRLPELGNSLGSAIHNFKRSISGDRGAQAAFPQEQGNKEAS